VNYKIEQYCRCHLRTYFSIDLSLVITDICPCTEFVNYVPSVFITQATGYPLLVGGRCLEVVYNHRCTRFENPGRGSVRFLPNFGRGYIEIVKILKGGYTFLVFYCIFNNKFCKNFVGRVHFQPVIYVFNTGLTVYNFFSLLAEYCKICDTLPYSTPCIRCLHGHGKGNVINCLDQ
jgi:hypothetical protein